MSDIPTPDGWETIGDLGWIGLPYGCFGLIRRTGATRSNAVWSWLVLVPWAGPTTKAWIDGTYLIKGEPLPTEERQHAEVLAHVRAELDGLYGESVGGAAVDRLLREMGIDEPDDN